MDLRPPDTQNIRTFEFADLPPEEAPEFQDLISRESYFRKDQVASAHCD